MNQDAAELVAKNLRDAEANCSPISPVAESLGAENLDAAYLVQEINTGFHLQAGRKIGGRKIGLTSKSVQKQIGVDQPDFGMLWKDTEYQDGEEIPFSRLCQPRIECEIAFVLGKDLNQAQPGMADLIQAIDYVVPSLEIVDSRIADWKIGIVDTIADNASSGMYVLGGPTRKLEGLDLRMCGMVVERNGEPVSTGCGAACMEHPLNAAMWLAKVMVERGIPLQAGDVVLSGALGPMVDVKPGDVFHARINGLGSVRASFGS